MGPKKDKSQSPLPSITRTSNRQAPNSRGAIDDTRHADVRNGDESVTLAEVARKIDYLVSKIDRIDSILERLSIIETRVEDIAEEYKMLKGRIIDLESRMDEYESSKRNCHIIMSCHQIAQLPTSGNLTQIVVDLLKRTINYTASFWHSVTRYQAWDTVSWPLEFDVKTDQFEHKEGSTSVLQESEARRSLFEWRSYANRAKILYTLRQSKKKYPQKIAGHGSLNGSVYVFLTPPDANARAQRVLMIR